MALYQTGTGLSALVGIGTTNPTSNLQVVGNVLSGNVIATVALYGALAGANTIAGSSLTVSGNMTSSGYIQATGTGAGATGSIFANSTNGLVVRGVTGSSYDFSILNPAGGSYVMAVPTGTNNLYFAGNIGIGTASPTAPLNVWGSGAFSGLTANPQPGQLIVNTTNGSERLILGAWYTGGTGSICSIQASDYYSSADHGQGLVLNPLGGSVGIGTNPVTRLDVWTGTARSGTAPGSYGSIYATADSLNTNSSSTPIAEFRHSNQTQGIAICFDGLYATGSNTNQALCLKPKGASEVQILGTGVGGGGYGNFLIDYANSGSAGGSMTLRNSSGGNGAFASLLFEIDGSTACTTTSNAPTTFNQANGMLYCQNLTSTYATNGSKMGLQLWSGGSEFEIQTWLPNGNVGINNTSPTYPLDVTGKVRGSREIISSSITDSGQFRAIGGNYGAFIRNDGSDTYWLVTNSADQYGSWNGLRPWRFNNASGYVTMDNGCTISSGATVNGGLTSTGDLSASATNANLLLNRGAIWWASIGDTNHYLYNNYLNRDGAGGFDGMKWNTYNGLWIRGGLYGANTGFFLNSSGNVGIGFTSQNYKFEVYGRSYFWGTGLGGGGQNQFTGLEADSNANGRAQIVLNSSYSDMVICSSQINGNHGSTISFTTNSTANNDYRKFVINQNNWGADASGTGGYGDRLCFDWRDAAYGNPHGYVDPGNCTLLLYGRGHSVGINNVRTPGYNLHVNGNDYATGRRYTSDWFSNYGTAGLYNDSYGNSFYKNDAYYGNWKIDSGNAVNGWNGIRFTNQELSLMMGTTGGDKACGIHMNGTGWVFLNDAGRNLYIPGDITAYWSDRRLKKDFVQVEDYDEILNGMTAYRFKWNALGEKMTSGAVKENDDSLSLIAQDVQAVLPHAVKVNKAGQSAVVNSTEKDSFDYLTIDFDKITPVLVEALKQTRRELRETRERLIALEKLVYT